MKTSLNFFKAFFIVGAMACVSSCDNIIMKEDHDKQIQRITAADQQRADSMQSNYFATMDEIDKNLDQIRDQYGVIVTGPKSNDGVVVKEQIINNITAINNLLAENKSKISDLEKKIAKNKQGKAELLKSIEIAKVRIEEQTKIVEAMKEELLKKDYRIEELSQTILGKEESIALITAQKQEKQAKLEKKYFAYGTSKTLRDRHLVKERKGFDKIAKQREINPKADTSAFASLNMYEKTELAMVGKEPKLLTAHPEGSYTLVPEGDKLTLLKIKDPDEFWKTSNYLVVQVK